MKIIEMLIIIIGILCIFLGLLTPLNSFLFIGIGIAMVLISAVISKFLNT